MSPGALSPSAELQRGVRVDMLTMTWIACIGISCVARRPWAEDAHANCVLTYVGLKTAPAGLPGRTEPASQYVFDVLLVNQCL